MDVERSSAASRCSSVTATTSSCSCASSATRLSAWPSARPATSRRPTTSSPTSCTGGSSTRRSAGRPTSGRRWSIPIICRRSAAGCTSSSRTPRCTSAWRRLSTCSCAWAACTSPTPTSSSATSRASWTPTSAPSISSPSSCCAPARVFQRGRGGGRVACRLHADRRDLRAPRHAHALPAQAAARGVVEPPGAVLPRRAPLLVDPRSLGPRAVPLRQHDGDGAWRAGVGQGPPRGAPGPAERSWRAAACRGSACGRLPRRLLPAELEAQLES